MNDLLPTTWYGFAAFALESDLLRAVFVPELGAKIVSLYDKVHAHEWLAPPVRPLRPCAYGAGFVEQDMSGWDEMIPTIVACEVEGARLPDHGEVWSLPWRVEATEAGKLTLAVDGLAMPYRLARSATLGAPGCLELHYRLANTGRKAFPYLWAAHPQFVADAQTRIVLPPDVERVVNVIAGDPVWGAAGEAVAWPRETAADGQAWALDIVRGVEHKTCRKFYLPPERPAAWAALQHTAPDCCLRLDWSAAELPYLGLWVDEGMYNTLPIAAPEPSNGYYDSLAWAIANRRVARLEAGQEAEWVVRVSIG